METRNLPLRILYTINSSPQYILARSSSPCPVVLVPPIQNASHTDRSAATQSTISETESRPKFGTAPLKTCLDAICRSSPELLQDPSRDFSVYVLDPLESNSAPAPVNISSSGPGFQDCKASASPSKHPRGVAVGFGLMSWAMAADAKDSSAVTGTLIKLGTGQEALEIIFALRETAAMEKTSLPAALRSWVQPPYPLAKLGGVYASNSHLDFKHPSGNSTSTASSSYAISTHSIATTSSQTVENPTDPPFGAIPSSRGTSSTLPSSHASYSADVATLATIASIQMRSQQKRAKSKSKKAVKPPFINPEISEADRLLLSEDVYVGPVKKKGRPVNATASGSGSGSSNDTTSRRNSEASSPTIVESEEACTTKPVGSVEPGIPCTSFTPTSHACKAQSPKQSPNQQCASLPFVSTPLVRPPRNPEPPVLLDILAALSVSSSSTDPNIQNAALLAALNAIDSTPAAGSSTSPEKTPHPALVNALRELLSAVSQQDLPPKLQPDHHPSHNGHNRTHSPDDDVILLDKENVNPTAFRRRSERDGKVQVAGSSPSLTGVGTVLGPSYSAVNESPPHNRSLSTRSNGTSNAIPVGPTLAKPSTNAGLRRKRTLSDVMDERESEKDKGKGKERELQERRDGHRHAHSSTARTDLSANRHYPRLILDGLQPQRKGTNSYYRTGMEPWTSPPRQKDENSAQQPIIVNDSPQAPRAPATSPLRPKATQPQARRRYVIPTWARTETALQPRLSQEAQRALEVAEEQKRKEREGTKRRGANRGEKVNKKQRVGRSASPTKLVTSGCQAEATARQPTQRPPPVTLASDCPVFAMASAMQDRIAAFASPSAPFGSNSSGSVADDRVTLPRTPPRKRHSDLFSPGEGDSLFTPIPIAPVSDPCSSTVTPMRSRSQVPTSSPKKGNRTPSRKAMATAEHENDASAEESDDDDIEDALNRELDVLQNLDMPSSSQTAANDVDMDDGIRPDREDVTEQDNCPEDDGHDGHVDPPRQHWEGLPPSSPLPPTSPILTPQDEEPFSDDMELPTATSDAEPWPTDSEAPESSFSEHDLSTCTDEGLAEFFKDNDFTSLFPPAATQPDFGSDTQSKMDLFDQFTNHNLRSDSADQNLGMNVDPTFDLFQDGLTDLDFTEFWETFKPLVQDQKDAAAAGNAQLEIGQRSDGQDLEVTSVDHVKLAEDVQALFSGCLM
ncbi:hypothetical protein LshimejAT787_0404200 [Lyophyllum shimeji]|uniref:Ams2/SPT21 N-terminal domain-containing protein n=1 Tax=Lyophyllum shimeji TaxID=47721 RepID=A0A9P3PKZ0_LYOSH|nr:hypothetical protein LshimejAT787_0404200 [Lyophyllum shimeji]